jgi:hypothetical protein
MAAPNSKRQSSSKGWDGTVNEREIFNLFIVLLALFASNEILNPWGSPPDYGFYVILYPALLLVLFFTRKRRREVVFGHLW